VDLGAISITSGKMTYKAPPGSVSTFLAK